MLTKSRKSAFFMAVLFTTTALIVTGAILGVRHLTGTFDLEAGGNGSRDSGNNVIELIIAILALVFVVGLESVMLSLWIYRDDDSHFGSRGAIRWAMTGAICAILVHPALVLMPRSGSAESPWLAGLTPILRLCWGLFVFELSYHLVFKWFPHTRERHTQQPDRSREDPIAMTRSGAQNPANISELLVRVRQDPDARLGYQVMSRLIIGGGIIMLIIGLTTPGHPNPHLLPSLVVMGFDCVITGIGVLLFLRQSRIAPWFMLLSCILFAIFVYLLVRVITYS